MINLTVGRDTAGTPLYSIPFTDAGYAILLPANDNTAGTVATIVVPADATKLIFGYASGVEYWVGLADFSIPSTTGVTFTALDVYQNPPPLNVVAGQTLYIRSATAATLTLAFYS